MCNNNDREHSSQNSSNLKKNLPDDFHAVIFTGGLFAPPQNTKKYWAETGQPDFIVAADSGLEICDLYCDFYKNEYDFFPDIITGDFDSLNSPALIEKYKIKPNVFPCDKDFTDTELAVASVYKEAQKHGVKNPHITLVGGDGGRTDHLLNIYDSFASEKYVSVWLAKEQGLYLLKDGFSCDIFELGIEDIVSVARTSASRTKGALRSEGLVWEANCFRKEGMPSLSNRISQEFYDLSKPVRLCAKGADFLVIAPLSAVVIMSKSAF